MTKMTSTTIIKVALLTGFCAGLAFEVAQRVTWWVTGLMGFCYG
ncbi:TPA: hypothetical protein ACNVV3_000954 [Pseudomonas putida]